jgi:hypothetical protein
LRKKTTAEEVSVEIPIDQPNDAEDAEDVEDVETDASVQREPIIRRRHCSQQALAQEVILNNGIAIVASQGAFMVAGSNGNKYAVTLHPKETCQCPSTTTCYHIIACKLSINNVSDVPTKVINMTQLRKNSRTTTDKKSGRKRPRPKDVDVEVIPAPDSEEAMNKKRENESDNDMMTSLLRADVDVEILSVPSENKQIKLTVINNLATNKSKWVGVICFYRTSMRSWGQHGLMICST